MRAIILAAGRGSRLGELTETSPKCLVHVFGKPLLHHQIEALNKANIDDIAIVTGYQSDKIIDQRLKHFYHNPEWSSSNMVSSLLCASEWLRSDDCIISYSDIFYESFCVSQLLMSKNEFLLSYDVNFRSLWEARFTDPLSDLETFVYDHKNKLTLIGSRTNTYSEIMGQYMGLLKCTPSAWNRIESFINENHSHNIKSLDMTSLLMILIKNHIIDIEVNPYNGVWGEVDHRSDIEFYESKYPNFPETKQVLKEIT